MNYFIFNGESCRAHGMICTGQCAFNAPERDGEEVEVAGRNGNLFFSNNRFKNIDVTYPVFVKTDYRRNTATAREWLLAPDTYCVLRDSYNPNEFRLARYQGGLEFSNGFANWNGEAEITFTCKPQRFLDSGEQWITFTSSTTLMNKTAFESRPLIKANGTSGTITIGSTTFSLTGLTDYVYIDCDTMNCYKGTSNQNSNMTGNFPTLVAGNNAIGFTGFTSIEIKPRWWTI